LSRQMMLDRPHGAKEGCESASTHSNIIGLVRDLFCDASQADSDIAWF